jgi:hypothetical protein
VTSVDVLSARSRFSSGVAAAPELALAATCLAAIFIPDVGARFAPRLLLTLGLEFLGIHGFVFLGALALMRPKEVWSKILRVAAFAGVCVLYSLFAANWGRDAVASFWAVTVSTYFGFFVHDAPQDRRRMLVCRWIVVAATYLGLMIMCLVIFEIAGVRAPTKGFLFGFLFFATLGIFDVTRFYERVATPLLTLLRPRNSR